MTKNKNLLRLSIFSFLAIALIVSAYCLPGLDLSAGEKDTETSFAKSWNKKDKSTETEIEPLPLGGLLPKSETGATRFYQQYPKANGSGTIVAIFDTGVDPGVEGLQTTPDGRPKIVDLVDGTGSGDVDTSVKRKVKDGTLLGLSGKSLKLGDWKNPKAEYYVGLKAAYDFFPSDPGRGGSLVERLKRERKEKFDERQSKREAKLRTAIENSKSAKKDVKEKLKAQLEVLEMAKKNYNDPGPIFDCVVFHDGDHWQAIVDTDEDGDLSNEKVLTNYRACRKYGTFPSPANLNFAVNIYEEGKLLSIVVDAGRHGTHVAGIVAAHYPGQPELDGVAPGTQIISVKIGDTRLYGMETGAGFERGIKAVLDNNCDLVNLSYGESTTAPNKGWLTRMLADLVTEKGVIFISSAGNSGPALTTVGGPGGTTSEIIGVGAYVSEEMMKAEYTLRETQPGLPYTWTSQGPTADGDLGVDIFAPGGAVAPIPQWSLQKSEMLNGTSMASPNACGNVALMLSAAKAESLPYSPASVKRALKNTAVFIEAADRFAQGAGLIQVDRAYEFLKSNAKANSEKFDFQVRLPRLHNARGIYLRELQETNRKLSTRVEVAAVFPKEIPDSEKFGFDLRLEFVAQAEWVTTGQFMLLTHGANSFDIDVDPRSLKPGVHYTQIDAYEAGNRDRGVLFSVPITVVKPHGEDELSAKDLEFKNGTLIRKYFIPPHGATWARLKLQANKTSANHVFRFHSMQLLSGTHFEAGESSEYFVLSPHRPKEHSFPIQGGRIMEMVLTKYWSDVGDCSLEYELEFFGAEPSDDRITISQGDGVQPVDIKAGISSIYLEPKATLNTLRKTLLPTSSKILALDPERYLTTIGEPIYELALTYPITLKESSSLSPIAPQLDDLLYDSPMGPYHFTIKNENGKLVHTNDMFPDSAKLEKGKYTLVLTLHHHQTSMLEKWKTLPLGIDYKSKSVSVSMYESPERFSNGRSGVPKSVLSEGEILRLYVGEPKSSDLPKDAEPGDQLLGSITYIDASSNTGKETYSRPGGYPLRYIITSSKSDKKSSSDSSTKPLGSGKTVDDKLQNARIDFLMEQLKSLTKEDQNEEFEDLVKRTLKKYPEDKRALKVRMHRLDDEKTRKKHLEKVIDAANAVIAEIDQDKLAAYFGTRHDSETDEEKALHKKMTSQKETLIDALYRKARAVAYRELPDVVKENPIKDQKKQDAEFDEAVKALSKWVDVESKEYFLLAVRKERRKGKHAAAIKLLSKHSNNKNPEFLHLKKLRDLYGEMGWEDLKNSTHKRLLLEFPKKNPPF